MSHTQPGSTRARCWLFAAWTGDTISQTRLHQLKARLPLPANETLLDGCWLAAGEKTTPIRVNGETVGYVSGTAYTHEGETTRIVDGEEWGGFAAGDCGHPAFDGNYSSVWVWNHQLRYCVSHLGARRLYHMSVGGAVLVSTHWWFLTSFMETPTLDLHSFGAAWSLDTPVEHRSMFTGVSRTSPGEVGRVNRSRKVARDITPLAAAGSLRGSLRDMLRAPFLAHACKGESVSLGLSGGYDSRILFAVLQPTPSWLRLHTFGVKENYDVIVAQNIARDFGVPITSLQPESYSLPTDEIIANCAELAVYSESRASMLSWMVPCYLKRVHADDRVFADGIMGEILRDVFFTKLRLELRLHGGSFESFKRAYIVRRVPIFRQEVQRRFEQAAAVDVEQLREPFDKMSLARFIEYTVMQCRQANNTSQRLYYDEIVNMLTPFKHASIVNAILSTPQHDRKACRTARRLIRHGDRRLARYPVIHYETPIPWSLAPRLVTAYPWARLQRRLGNVTPAPLGDMLLMRIGEYVRDRASDAALREHPLLDGERIAQAVDGYYSRGERSQAKLILAWLSFQFFSDWLSGK